MKLKKERDLISKLIKNKRKKMKLTQREFGDLVGCSRSLICDWENQKRVPRGDTLVYLSKKLDVNFVNG